MSENHSHLEELRPCYSRERDRLRGLLREARGCVTRCEASDNEYHVGLLRRIDEELGRKPLSAAGERLWKYIQESSQYDSERKGKREAMLVALEEAVELDDSQVGLAACNIKDLIAELKEEP